MPAEYVKLGIPFQYPENWTLDEEDALAGHKAVTVYSPGGGFWSVAVHPAADPARLARAALDAMKEEYKDLESEEVRETVAGHELVGYDINFFYLDLTSTARVRSLRVDQASYTIFCQAEDREFRQVHRVFDAMTVSLLSGLKKLSYWE